MKNRTKMIVLVGILLFVISAVTKIPLTEIIREIWAFLAVLLVALLAMRM